MQVLCIKNMYYVRGKLGEKENVNIVSYITKKRNKDSPPHM
jgi:hypothetical protein